MMSASSYAYGAMRTGDAQPKLDPSQASILLFPGQGSQFVGMGSKLLQFPRAKELFQKANEILGYDLQRICVEGPESELNQTIYCQPAVLVCSLAAVERLKQEQPEVVNNCVATAGFSLGEISALVFAGVISFEKALRLVKIRAEAMDAAVKEVPSGMMTVFLGPDSELDQALLKAKERCRELGIKNPECCVSNSLFPYCKVVAGHLEALKFLEDNASQFKLQKLARRPLAGAFHSSVVERAVEPFGAALGQAGLVDPWIPVYSNVDGLAYKGADHICELLPRQIIKSVMWEQTMNNMYDQHSDQHVPKTFECGPGNALKSVLRRLNTKAWENCFSVEI